MKLKLVLFTILFSVFCITTTNARSARSHNYPNFDGEILFELKHDALSDNSKKVANNDRENDTNLLIEPIFFLNLTEGFKINNHWAIRPIEERKYTTPTVGNSIYYGGTFYGTEGWIKRDFGKEYGIIVEELELMYEKNDIRLGLGKFNPMFGTAFYKSRYHGIYGTDLPEEYELKEKFGGNIVAVFPNIQAEFSLFFDDVTHLSSSAIGDRGRDKSRGGAGNTEKLDSFSIAIEGANFLGHKDFNYNFGFRYLKTEKNWERDEKGYVLGLEYIYDIGLDSMIIPFFEYAYFDNYDGIVGRDTQYTTLSLVGIKGNWNTVVSNTLKREEESNFSDIRDYVIQYTIGYKFENGLMFDLGLKDSKQSIKTNTRTTYKQRAFGGKISYMLIF
ncbi:hypothetical protein ACFL0U_01630 [Pseudomonadota bacterium]